MLSKGVSRGDQVVVDVPYALTDGSEVQVKQAGAADDDAKRKPEIAKSDGKSSAAPEK